MLTRTHSVDGTWTFEWDGIDMVRETDPSGNVTRYFIVNGVLRVGCAVIGKVVRRAGQQAGIKRPVGPHDLRHALGSEWNSLPGSEAMRMLKIAKGGKKTKTPTEARAKTKAQPRAGAKAEKEIPPENLRVIALLEQWKRQPVTEEERQAWEDTMKSLDESRPHRPLFS